MLRKNTNYSKMFNLFTNLLLTYTVRLFHGSNLVDEISTTFWLTSAHMHKSGDNGIKKKNENHTKDMEKHMWKPF